MTSMLQPGLAPSLAALVASRICHDVIGPVGAISNGLELVETLGDTATPEDFSLISDSAQAARARIEFMRIAFGRPGVQGKVTISDLEQILRAAYPSERLKISINASAQECEPSVMREISLAVMCAEKALPRGGSILVTGEKSGVTVSATGNPCKLPERFSSILNSTHTPAAEPNEVEFALLRDAAAGDGCHMQITQSDNGWSASIALRVSA